jgi:hypothetical protein
MWRDDGRGIAVKGNDNIGWSYARVVLWLGRKQNGDMVEWCWEWPRLRWPFYSSGGWESGYLRRVAGGCGEDSILWFWFKRGDDEMKRRRQARLCFMGRKCDMARWRGDVSRRRVDTQGGERDETMLVRLTQILLGQKIKKIYTVDSIVTNWRWRFKAMMS